MYLPSHSTIDEACEWLNHQTGQKWTLPRLLEDGHLRVYVWIDYVEGLPHVFGDRREGYLTEMVFHGDVMRLAADRDEAVLTWITTHDGKPQQTGAWRVELKHVRFKRDALEQVSRKRSERAPSMKYWPICKRYTETESSKRLVTLSAS